MRTRILGTGMHVPPRAWRNDELRQFMDTSDEWIRQRTGIEQRHWVDPESGTTTTDLALEASRKALAAAKLSPADLDAILFATISPDHEFPGAACFLQAKLDVPAGVPAIDVRQGCSGFLYGLSMADAFIRAGQFKRVLLVGAELHSKGLDKSDEGRDVAVLFGDGAGAVVLGAVPESEPHVLSTHLHSDGRFARELWLPAPGMAFGKDRVDQRMIDEKLVYPRMNGKLVFVHAVKRMPEVLQEALAANGKTLADVDLFLFHQANLRINEMITKTLGIPEAKVFNTIQRYGNTTAATIPIGMDEAVRAGALKPGMLVACVGFGTGFSWGSALLNW